ncbi:MAG: Uma2 family endonuclease [Alkalinema sp. RU_4_3]|nr:Uma2 family endonuclease [Alkalinema sp. RU_4_3]
MTTLLQVQPLLDTWQPAGWEEFVALADDPQYDKLKCYYYDGKMRFEPMATGADHSKDHVLIMFALSLFTATQGIQANGHDGCSYRKTKMDEFQPDISYYVGAATAAIPWGTRVVDLDQYPSPDLVIEISDTSLADDLGTKRLQYEDLRIPEYWIVNVKAMQVLGFSIASDGTTQRIQESRVLAGLKLGILEEALVRSRGESQSATNAWLMQQFQG